MDRCRTQYFKEIDIVEHIMQFREVRAELEQAKTQMKRGSFFKKARTKVLSEMDDEDEGDDTNQEIVDESTLFKEVPMRGERSGRKHPNKVARQKQNQVGALFVASPNGTEDINDDSSLVDELQHDSIQVPVTAGGVATTMNTDILQSPASRIPSSNIRLNQTDTRRYDPASSSKLLMQIKGDDDNDSSYRNFGNRKKASVLPELLPKTGL